jgi:hypothetical protein
VAIALDKSLGSANGGGGNQSQVQLTTSQAAAAGSKIFVAVGHFRNAVTGVSDNGPGLTWSQVSEVANGSNYISLYMADAPSGMASGTVITVTFAAANTLSPQICAASWTGVVTGTTTDGGAKTGTGSGTGWSTAGITTTNADALVVCAGKGGAGADNTDTPLTNYLELYDFGFGTGDFITLMYRIVSATGTYTPGGTWAGSSSWAAASAAYDAAAVAAAAPPRHGYVNYQDPGVL